MEWYKKYRPPTLDEIVGQQHVVKTFKKRFAEKNIPQTIGLLGGSGCVDADTEFFNGYGWKKISEYNENDLVLQYNKDGSTTLIKPINYIKNKCDYLWHFKNVRLDQCLSESHNVFYINSTDKLLSKTLKDIKEEHEKNASGFHGRFITTFKYNGKGINLTDNEIKLMCAVICDSAFTKNSNICYFNLKKDRKKEALRKLLNEMNYEYREKTFKSMPGYTRFYLRASIITKKFDKYWYDCNQHQLQIICDNILQWDGHEQQRKNVISRSFCTTDKETTDFIQFAFSACGFRVTISMDKRKGQEHKVNNKIYIRKSNYYNLSISKNILVSLCNNRNKIKFNEYKTTDGYEYCFTVNSGMLVLRRENKIFITGNSGKDSIARIIAMAVTCDKPDTITGYPCLSCSSCKDVLEERFSHTVKNKNASNLTVDDMRDLENDANIYTWSKKPKVYIITEYQEMAHKASKNALEQFENNNPNAYFIITSMDKTKVPDAIKDRGQTYYLKDVEWEDLFKHLYSILEKEHVRYPAEFCDLENATGGLFTIAQNCTHSIRKAVSYLEQCVYAEAWSEQEVSKILEIYSNETIGKLVTAIISNDITTLLNEKWNESLLLEVRSMFLDVYKFKINIDNLRNNQEQNSNYYNKAQNTFIKNIAINTKIEKIKKILDILFEINKYNYWNEKLIEFSILNCCNI